MAAVEGASHVPLVDFTTFRSGTPNQAKTISKQLYEAFRDVGFVYLKNHGVPQDVVDEAFSWVSYNHALLARFFMRFYTCGLREDGILMFR